MFLLEISKIYQSKGTRPWIQLFNKLEFYYSNVVLCEISYISTTCKLFLTFLSSKWPGNDIRDLVLPGYTCFTKTLFTENVIFPEIAHK